jgi:hypothetical protein
VQVPVNTLQLSAVHGLVSTHRGVPRQTEELQISFSVHRLPSLQGDPFRFPVTVHDPLPHCSVVQGLPSLHGPVRFTAAQVPPTQLHCWQVVDGGHLLLSLKETQRRSSLLQKMVSQLPPVPQFRGAPGKHCPAEQKSFTEQKRPSSQLPATAVWRQAPLAGSQPSWVHALPSSQLCAAAPQVPVAGTQASSVQGSPSSQTCRVPPQTTFPDPAGLSTQRSVEVHAFASSHAVPGVSAVPTHCPPRVQASETVHPLPSSHAVPAGRSEPVQAGGMAPLQASPWEHGFPSSHAVPAGCATKRQPT